MMNRVKIDSLFDWNLGRMASLRLASTLGVNPLIIGSTPPKAAVEEHNLETLKPVEAEEKPIRKRSQRNARFLRP